MKKILLDEMDLCKIIPPISYPAAVKIMHRADAPIVNIGGKRYLHAELFMQWLREHANGIDITEDR